MGLVLFQNLTASEAEQVVSGIWLAAERYGWGDPRLSFQFHKPGGRVSITVACGPACGDLLEFGRLLNRGSERQPERSSFSFRLISEITNQSAVIPSDTCSGENEAAALQKGRNLHWIDADGFSRGLN